MDDTDSVMETPKSSSVDIDMTSTNQPTPAALDAEPRGANQLTSTGDHASTTTAAAAVTHTAVKSEPSTKFRAFNNAASSRVSHDHEAEADADSATDTRTEEVT